MKKRKKTSKVRFVAFFVPLEEKKVKINLLAETNESDSEASEEFEGLGDEIDEEQGGSLEDETDSKSKSKRSNGNLASNWKSSYCFQIWHANC